MGERGYVQSTVHIAIRTTEYVKYLHYVVLYLASKIEPNKICQHEACDNEVEHVRLGPAP